MNYIVNYIDSKGSPANLKIDARSIQEARWLSGIPERRIVAVKEDTFGRFVRAVSEFHPEAKNQAIFMQSLASSLASGQTVHQATKAQLSQSGWAKHKKSSLDRCENLSDYLSALKFDRFAVLMAKTAEKTGQFSDALKRSSRYLLDQEKIKSETHAEFRTGVVYIILGMLFLLGIPSFIGPTLVQVSKNGGFSFENNIFSLYLLHSSAFLKHWGWVVLPVSLVVFLNRIFVWRTLAKFPFFNLFELNIRLKRGIQFMSAYQMLHEAGFVDTEIVLELLQAAPSQDREVYQRMYAHLANSEDISRAFEPQDWPVTVRDAMAFITDMEKHQHSGLIGTVQETLKMENVHVARQISLGLSRFGFVLMILSVVTAILGFYVPIIEATSHGFAK